HRFLRGNARLHPAFRKMDDEEFQAGPRNCLNLDPLYLTNTMSGINDKFVLAEFKKIFRSPYLAAIAFNREFDSGLMGLVRAIEPSMFQIHSAVNPFLRSCASSVARLLLRRVSARFYADDADDTIPPKCVASWQLVPNL